MESVPCLFGNNCYCSILQMEMGKLSVFDFVHVDVADCERNCFVEIRWATHVHVIVLLKIKMT